MNQGCKAEMYVFDRTVEFAQKHHHCLNIEQKLLTSITLFIIYLY